MLWCRGRGNAGRTVRIDAPRDEMKNEMTIYYRIAATKMASGVTEVMLQCRRPGLGR